MRRAWAVFKREYLQEVRKKSFLILTVLMPFFFLALMLVPALVLSKSVGEKRVAVVDDTPWLGGQIWRGEQTKPKQPQAQEWLERFAKSGATVLDRTSVIAAPEKNLLLAEHPDGAREIRWEKLILATGARELFLPFPGWTLPGVVGPGGLQALVKNGWPICFRSKRWTVSAALPAPKSPRWAA